MRLYCHECNELHRFTEGEVELIVYTLQAEAADAEMSADDPYDLSCLRSSLEAATHAEMYREHTEALVARRRELANQGDEEKETNRG